MKRLVDILGAGIALIVLSPVFLLVGIGVLFDRGIPVLFHQIRPGLDERTFTLLKFRTMDDDRASRFGAFLRKWSLDELPQLINVLAGHMSLVGPRPLLTKYLPFYTARERMRHTVRPGITGWAQIHGRNQLSWDERLEMDVWYVENRSLRLDLKIMAVTLGQLLSARDVVANPNEVPLPDLDVARQDPVA